MDGIVKQYHMSKSVVFLNISTNGDREFRFCLLGCDRADRKSIGFEGAEMPAAHTDLS